MRTVKERVAAGVVWLDENVEEWRSKVSLLTFNIRNDCDCVLGQIFHDAAAQRSTETWEYPSGFDYAVGIGGMFFDPEQAVALGFDAQVNYDALQSEGINADFDALQAEWVRVLCSAPVLR